MVINEFILKVASRCNLNCSYCYMYNMGDTTYLNQPKFMSLEIIEAFARKAKNHCDKNNVPIVHIAFHGGEPLLIDKSLYYEAVKIINSTLQGIEIIYILQTNGTLLSDEWCELFKKLNIQVGISIDGTEIFHNQYRIYHNKEGSFDDVIHGIKIRDKHSEGGLISVINIDIPPKELYNFFLSVKAQLINILLPDNHYDNLPKGMNNLDDKNETLYGDWMIELYKCWSSHKDVSRPMIPFFENIISLILGYEKGDELVGKRKNRAVTIETDGAIEVVDPLRICGNGFTRNDLNVVRNEISEIESLKLFKEYYNSHDDLCYTCLNCPIQKVCGGGYLGHRFSKKNRFDNPSIYCKDLMKLIAYIQNDILSIMPQEVFEKIKIEPISYDEIYYITRNPMLQHN